MQESFSLHGLPVLGQWLGPAGEQQEEDGAQLRQQEAGPMAAGEASQMLR